METSRVHRGETSRLGGIEVLAPTPSWESSGCFRRKQPACMGEGEGSEDTSCLLLERACPSLMLPVKCHLFLRTSPFGNASREHCACRGDGGGPKEEKWGQG